ncbi:hypothetical protein J6590_033326 [Homalodisca vitripennis]|nr:hypothetical protein J6590_033326 [Homalodisca vitripennis]
MKNADKYEVKVKSNYCPLVTTNNQSFLQKCSQEPAKASNIPEFAMIGLHCSVVLVVHDHTSLTWFRSG